MRVDAIDTPPIMQKPFDLVCTLVRHAFSVHRAPAPAAVPKRCAAPRMDAAGSHHLAALVAVVAILWSAPAQAEKSGRQRAQMALKAKQATDATGQAEYPAHKTAVAGSAILQFKQTFESRGSFETLMFQMEVEHQTRQWGFLAVPRLRFADFQHLIGGSTLWLHQGYAFYAHPWAQVKLGKVLSIFGRVWDYGFYGPLLANNDVKLAPDIGLTIEGSQQLQHHVELYYGGQYSPIDGRALAIGHGQPLRLNTRREHIAALRVAPSYKPHRDVVLSFGVSGQRFVAVQLDRQQVLRAEADIDVHWRNLSGFVELGLQHGEDKVVSQNVLITSNSYVWTGLEYAIGPASLRYHFNAIGYNDAQQTSEYLHQPGLALAAGPHCTFVAELALWHTSRVIPGRGEHTLYLFAGGLF